MDLLTAAPGIALGVGLLIPRARRVLSRHAVVVQAQRTLEQSRMVGLRH